MIRGSYYIIYDKFFKMLRNLFACILNEFDFVKSVRDFLDFLQKVWRR